VIGSFDFASSQRFKRQAEYSYLRPKKSGMRINDIISAIESFAPSSYQDSYDNSGLLVGDAGANAGAVLVSLDCTEAVVDEAIRLKANLIVSHHPIIFSALKRITPQNYIGRTVIKAIQNNIALYAAHTNLDHVRAGVNSKIGQRLGLQNLQILAPRKQMLHKLITYVPLLSAEPLRQALFGAGAGQIGKYDSCSFSSQGQGTFRAGAGANPAIGKIGEYHSEAESRIEVVYPEPIEKQVLTALRAVHPYEEPAYDIYVLENEYKEVGAGAVGELPEALDEKAFLALLKKALHAEGIRFTPLTGKKIKKVALCGGSGSFLLKNAIASGSDAFVTADYKYHQFFDAEGRILIADVGHFESEQFTKELLFEVIREKFPTFAVHLSETNTNPVNYL
jgi:dinuclear metal center YbgI/SA1388 family protein